MDLDPYSEFENFSVESVTFFIFLKVKFFKINNTNFLSNVTFDFSLKNVIQTPGSGSKLGKHFRIRIDNTASLSFHKVVKLVFIVSIVYQLRRIFILGSGARIVSVCYFDKENDWWVAKHIR